MQNEDTTAREFLRLGTLFGAVVKRETEGTAAHFGVAHISTHTAYLANERT